MRRLPQQTTQVQQECDAEHRGDGDVRPRRRVDVRRRNRGRNEDARHDRSRQELDTSDDCGDQSGVGVGHDAVIAEGAAKSSVTRGMSDSADQKHHG